MTLSGPLVIVGLPLGVAVVVWLLRRWTTAAAWLGAGAAVVVGGMVVATELGRPVKLGPVTIGVSEPFTILGRSLAVDAVDRLPLMFVFSTTAVLFIIGWRLLPRSNFFAAGLVMSGLLAGALMVQQVVYAAILVTMASVIGVLPLHEPRYDLDRRPYGGSTQGGLRYMVYAIVALPGLMITQLLLEQYTLFPGDQSVLRTATLLLGFSFAILLGVVPFQSWQSTVATDGSPPVVTFLYTVNLGTIWFLLLAYMETYRWLGQQALLPSLLTSVGLLMIVLGGALAASQRRLGRLVGYAVLVDNGAMLVALGSQSTAGLALSLVTLMSRPLALGLMTVGLDGLRRLGGGEDDLADLEGAGWRAPWRAVALVFGGIALAGFPLSLGFVARWGLFRLMVTDNLAQAIAALLGSAGVMMGLIGAVRVLLGRHSASVTVQLREDPIVLVLIVLLVALTLGLGIFPQPVTDLALRMAEGFTFLSP